MAQEPQKSSGDTLRAFIVGAVAVGSIWAVFSGSPDVSAPQQAAAVQQAVSAQGVPTVPVIDRATAPIPATDTGLSNDNHYTNSRGNTVHSPAYSDTVPAGATAQCRNGTYSFSQSRRGTCSHHGGVARWL